MADEPDNLVLRLLREIRSTQDVHGSKLEHIERQVTRIDRQVDDLYKISTHPLGVAANAHVRYEELSTQVEELGRRVTALEAKP